MRQVGKLRHKQIKSFDLGSKLVWLFRYKPSDTNQ